MPVTINPTMVSLMNSKHLSFCRSHDWGRDAQLVNGSITNLRDEYVDANGVLHRGVVSFSNWSELLAWAGY